MFSYGFIRFRNKISDVWKICWRRPLELKFYVWSGIIINFFSGKFKALLLCAFMWYRRSDTFAPYCKSSKQIGQRNYPPEIENLWNDLILLCEKRIKSDSKFSFNKMVLEIHKLLGEGKSIAVSTIRNFYLRRTIPRKTSIMAIRCWIEEEKKTVNNEDDEKWNSRHRW